MTKVSPAARTTPMSVTTLVDAFRSVPSGQAAGPAADDRLYTRDFFIQFVAVLCFMTGHSALFNYSRYVVNLGGGDDDVGYVVGAGLAAVLLCRPWLNSWVDRFGTTRVWFAGLAIYSVIAALNLLLTEVGPALYALRIVWNLAWGAIFVASTAYPAQTAPPGRRAEAVGSQGMGGFTGMMIGTPIGDWIFTLPAEQQYVALFWTAAGCAGFAALLVSLLKPAPRSEKPAGEVDSPLSDMLRWWPGAVSLIGICLGIMFALTMNFLARHAQFYGIVGFRTFFWAYCLSAVAVRIFLRRLPELFGRRKTMLTGVAFALAGYESFQFVGERIDYIYPGILLGLSHGLIFPSMVDLAGEHLPEHRRGLGTGIIVGCQELGMFLGAPLMGVLVEYFSFPTMFHALVAVVSAAAAVYIVSEIRSRRTDADLRVPLQKVP